MLVFVLAFILCCLYASDTIIISYCYRLYATHNPSSAKLLLLSEALKFAIASCLYLTEQQGCSEQQPEASHKYILAGAPCLVETTPRSSRRAVPQRPGSRQHRWHRVWQSTRAAAWTLAVFSVPSLCYFATNNLSFHALRLMSAHLYTLLCDLKIISTGLLSYCLLQRQLNRHAVLSLCGLFLGICMGQYSTMRGTAGSLGAMAAASDHKTAGFLLMLLISLISATASVHTEWVMNYSQYKEESLNLQNMRLYSIGVLLNGAYYWQTGGQLQGFWADVRPPHLAAVVLLALMGLLTGVLIKHYGNIVKVYAAAIASLFAAWVSQLLLQEPPPAMFYAGVCLAVAATVQLQQARTALTAAPADSPAASSAHAKSPRKPGGPLQQQQGLPKITASMVVPIVLAVMVLVFVPHMMHGLLEAGGSSGGSSVSTEAALPQLPLPANLNNPASLMPPDITHLPFPALPPFEPTCLVRFENRTQLSCRPLNCSLAESCSVTNTSCCAYFNFRLLSDVDALLLSKGLQGEYALVYGSALGAARNQSILGHTHDVDMALSPTALQVLAQNSTREQLWRRGYVFWHDRYLWRMCPHDLHPAPEFRAAMAATNTTSTTTTTQPPQQQQQGEDSKEAVQEAGKQPAYLDGYMMWRLPPGAASCAVKSPDPTHAARAAVMVQPLTAIGSAAARAAHSPHDLPDARLQQPADEAAAAKSGGEGGEGGEAGERRFCLQYSRSSIVVRPGERHAVVGGKAFPAPHDLEGHLLNTYGPNWRVPDTGYLGVSQKAPDWWAIQQALLARLAVTAWGDMAWPERRRRCAAISKPGGSSAGGAEAAGAADAAVDAAAEGTAGQQQQQQRGEPDTQVVLQELLAAGGEQDSGQQQGGRDSLQTLEQLQQQDEEQQQQQGVDGAQQ